MAKRIFVVSNNKRGCKKILKNVEKGEIWGGLL